MGALLALPIIGWFLGPLISMAVAIPFYVLWHWCAINTYFDFLPAKFVNIGFWDTVWLFLTISLLKMVCLPSMSCSCKDEEDGA